MKSNYNSLQEMFVEIDRVEQSKNDYLVSGKDMLMLNDSSLSVKGIGEFEVNDFAHGQVASKLNIPKNYYDNMSAIPDLRSHNVNAWLDANTKNKYFVRTLDNKARAFLSDGFRPIDNYDLMVSFYPVIKDLLHEVKTCAISEKKMYLQVTFPKMEMEITKGDVVQQGFILTNSEVGAGAIDLKHLIWRMICSNGMIGESTLRKYHIGKRMTGDTEIFRNDTIQAELESFKLRFRDILADMMNQKKFVEQCNFLKLAIDDKITKVNETVANVTKRFGLSEKLNDMIINNMAEEGNMNRYGLANGLTYLAHSLDNIDAQYEVEKMGSVVINMKRSEWNTYMVA